MAPKMLRQMIIGGSIYALVIYTDQYVSGGFSKQRDTKALYIICRLSSIKVSCPRPLVTAEESATLPVPERLRGG